MRRTRWRSCGQATLAEAACDIASSSSKLVKAMELDATISVDPIAAVAPPVQVLQVAIKKPEHLITGNNHHHMWPNHLLSGG